MQNRLRRHRLCRRRESKLAAPKETSDQSSPEPVVTMADKRQRRATKGCATARANHTILNPPAKKNYDYKLQIKFLHSVYNATVTEVLDDELVKVCTKDDCPTIANIKFKIVRLTEEQAKSDKAHGFTNRKANVGFPVEGAHDS